MPSPFITSQGDEQKPDRWSGFLAHLQDHIIKMILSRIIQNSWRRRAKGKYTTDGALQNQGGYVNRRAFNFAKSKIIVCYLSLRLHISTSISQASVRINPAEETGLISPTASTQKWQEEGKCCSISFPNPSRETLCEAPIALNQMVPRRQEIHIGSSGRKAGATAGLAIITFLQVPVSISL